jgi:hypothetical protein
MPQNGEALSEKVDRVKKLIEKFPAAASTLNSATDQLGKSVGKLDAVLKRFSLGIPTWVTFSGSPGTDPSYDHEDLGYAKIGGRWGIAIRTVSGDVRADEGDKVEQYPFNDAPRLLRVQAIPRIPELLTALLENAAKMSAELAAKAEEVDALTDGISAVIDPPKKSKEARTIPFAAKLLEALRDDATIATTDQPEGVTKALGHATADVAFTGRAQDLEGLLDVSVAEKDGW